MTYFRPEFHSLSRPHPILWTPVSNPHEVANAVIQLKMLSGRYRTGVLTSHWDCKGGCCPAPDCTEPETLEHILVFCPYYEQTRLKLKRLWNSSTNTDVHQLASLALSGPPLDLVQFILDPSVHPSVISLTQVYGSEPLLLIFYLTRTWCFSVHRERAKLQGRFKFN